MSGDDLDLFVKELQEFESPPDDYDHVRYWFEERRFQLSLEVKLVVLNTRIHMDKPEVHMEKPEVHMEKPEVVLRRCEMCHCLTESLMSERVGGKFVTARPVCTKSECRKDFAKQLAEKK